MEKKKLFCEVITPEKIVYQGEVDMVIVPGTEGELGVLPLHVPLITKLKHGELRVKIEDNRKHAIDIVAGLLRRKDDLEFQLQKLLESIEATREMSPYEIIKKYQDANGGVYR